MTLKPHQIEFAKTLDVMKDVKIKVQDLSHKQQVYVDPNKGDKK